VVVAATNLENVAGFHGCDVCLLPSLRWSSVVLHSNASARAAKGCCLQFRLVLLVVMVKYNGSNEVSDGYFRCVRCAVAANF